MQFIQFNSTQFNSIQFVHFNSMQSISIQFNLIQFNSIHFNSIQITSFNSIHSMKFISIQFKSFNSSQLIVNQARDLNPSVLWALGAPPMEKWLSQTQTQSVFSAAFGKSREAYPLRQNVSGCVGSCAGRRWFVAELHHEGGDFRQYEGTDYSPHCFGRPKIGEHRSHSRSEGGR